MTQTDTAPETPAQGRRIGESADPTLHVKDLWKVFGPKGKADHLIGTPDADLPRPEMLEKTGCVAAVKDISFDVAEGEVFVVMGLSGSGKSTLVRCLTRLIEPTAGTVSIDGNDITGASESKLRDLRRTYVSMVFQHFGLLPHRTGDRQRRIRARGPRHGQGRAPQQGDRGRRDGRAQGLREVVPRPVVGGYAAARRPGAGAGERPVACCSSTSRSRRSTR